MCVRVVLKAGSWPESAAFAVLSKLSHAAVMSFTWGLICIIGVTIARYYRHKPWWIDAHIRVQTIGTAGTVSGAAVAISMVQQQASSLHGVIGLALSAAVSTLRRKLCQLFFSCGVRSCVCVCLCVGGVAVMQASMGTRVHAFRMAFPVGTRHIVWDTVGVIHRNFGKLLFITARACWRAAGLRCRCRARHGHSGGFVQCTRCSWGWF